MHIADLVKRAIVAFNPHDTADFANVFADNGLIIKYADRVAGRPRDAIREYIRGMLKAYSAARVAMVGRIDVGQRQVTHEHSSAEMVRRPTKRVWCIASQRQKLSG